MFLTEKNEEKILYSTGIRTQVPYSASPHLIHYDLEILFIQRALHHNAITTSGMIKIMIPSYEEVLKRVVDDD